MKNREIVLCGGKKCCPTLSYEDKKDYFRLKDDFGGEELFTIEDLEELYTIASEQNIEVIEYKGIKMNRDQALELEKEFHFSLK